MQFFLFWTKEGLIEILAHYILKLHMKKKI